MKRCIQKNGPGTGQPVTIRPAICDKARKKQQGKNSDQILERFGVHLHFLAENLKLRGCWFKVWPEKTDEHPPFAIKPGKNSKVHTNLLIAYISRPRHCFLYLSVEVYISTVELGDKELFGHPRIVPYWQMFLILMK